MKTFIVFASVMAIALAVPHFSGPIPIPPAVILPTAIGQQAPAKPEDVPPSHQHNQNQEDRVKLVHETPSNNNGLGSYSFSFEQSDGQSREESAELVHIGSDHDSKSADALRVKGSYSWVDPVTKHTYTVRYEADEHGFRPQSTHLRA